MYQSPPKGVESRGFDLIQNEEEGKALSRQGKSPNSKNQGIKKEEKKKGKDKKDDDDNHGGGLL
jgi:hypothetical protein